MELDVLLSILDTFILTAQYCLSVCVVSGCVHTSHNKISLYETHLISVCVPIWGGSTQAAWGNRVGAGESSVRALWGGVRADAAVTSRASEEMEETMETELGRGGPRLVSSSKHQGRPTNALRFLNLTLDINNTKGFQSKPGHQLLANMTDIYRNVSK